ncbi:MAG: DUF695 domain-containing protein [Chitinophagales bacterium]|nr:DUF695 domain-containing protein [Chitinophagales bacterium]
MKLFKRLFSPNKTNESKINSYDDFWAWFKSKEQQFYKTVKSQSNIEKNFFNIIAPKLDEIKEGIFFLTGMKDENTVELILTPDGNLNNIVFVEDLVSSAPSMDSWLFTALKPELDISNTGIRMGQLEFNSTNIYFYPNTHDQYPDEIDITVIYTEWSEEHREQILMGVHIFLENFLGELNYITKIDAVNIDEPENTQQTLIPISKLKDYINWRQKEFVEKYEAVIYSSQNDRFSILETKEANGNFGIANINTDILQWDYKASHPWMCILEIYFDDGLENGMPNKDTQLLLENIQEALQEELQEQNGHISIGRLTANKTRTIYFACKDFRPASKAFYKLEQKHKDITKMNYEIYKDKYWQTLNQYSIV